MDTQTNNLLSQISAINKKYEKIADITGENFNIFKILRIEAEEVLTHSRFLCELLNPKGLHGKGNLFLILFLDGQKNDESQENAIFVNKLKDFDSNNCTVKSEVHVGFKNVEQTEGGRIDILMKENNSKNAIIIENKIYAGDQPQQLVRYNNAYQNAPIFYLTLELDDSKPSKDSKGDLIEGDNYKRISYKEDILDWLKICRKESVENPILREAITQYINLIKYLTRQTMNETMNEEVKKTILHSFENFESAGITASTYPIVRQNIINVFKEEIEKVSKGDVGEWKDFKITWYLLEDEGGFYIGFPARRNNEEIDNQIIELKPLVDIITSIDKGFKNNYSHVGWVNLKTVPTFISRFDNETIFKLSNEKFREEMKNNILTEAQEYVDKFKEKLNNLKMA